MTGKSGRRPPLAAAVVVVGSVVLLAAATPASAKTVTFHFFQKAVSGVFLGPAGQPVAPPGPTSAPVVGERFTATDDDFTGNHLRHAKRSTASDRLSCVFIDATGRATCSGQIAIGGSMLLADAVSVQLGAGAVKVPITGGTGIYKHAHGRTLSMSIGNTNNSDFVITVVI